MLEGCPDCASRSSSKHYFMWERRSLNLPSIAWMDKAEASPFRCDGLDSARKAILACSATKLTWRKQLGLPKRQDRKSFLFPSTTSREKRKESLRQEGIKELFP